MKIENKKASDVRTLYVGGGSRGWAWMLMSDLVSCEDMSGSVCLYDIDIEAAENNRIIGEKFNNAEGAKSKWSYSVADTLADAHRAGSIVQINTLPYLKVGEFLLVIN